MIELTLNQTRLASLLFKWKWDVMDNIKDMSAYFIKVQFVNRLGLSKRYLHWRLPDILMEVAGNTHQSLSFAKPQERQGQLILLADYAWLKTRANL